MEKEEVKVNTETQENHKLDCPIIGALCKKEKCGRWVQIMVIDSPFQQPHPKGMCKDDAILLQIQTIMGMMAAFMQQRVPQGGGGLSLNEILKMK